MIWANIGVFFAATVKFLVAAWIGRGIGNDFLTTFLVISIGGITGVTFFYYSANFFMERARKKRLESGEKKKNFTRMNKFLVRTKHRIGLYGLALLTASIISIPVGSIITAKFYGGQTKTIVVLYLAVLFVGIVTTLLAYIF